ncbi:PQ-loop repeat-containing protein 3-like [Rhinatrema bivittatum]|uniref:PQ-loop repeat-containing protein 3-like n=1 Tax=Rhinatrema bivittatum TaxID=194408 RepID=UPI00112917FE|nr:PQ-loop repeat-containing protein 3-like [Rhinatrema bivittatum]
MDSDLLLLANGSTLLVCMLMKFPQIITVMAAKSVQGVSLISILLELTGFLVFLRYQMYYGYPLETYLEYPILIAQDCILLLFVFYYTGGVNQVLPYIIVFIAGWHIIGLQSRILDLAMNLCTFISASSKLVQLQSLWQTKTAGQVSALTWGLAAFTCAILVRFIVMLVLNVWVTMTVLLYRKSDKKTN